jgi:hypothetical protein
MEFLNFLREDPVTAWLVFLGLLLALVPVAAVLWRKMSGRKPMEETRDPARVAKPIRFGNQTELFLIFVGILFLLSIAAWIGGIFLP